MVTLQERLRKQTSRKSSNQTLKESSISSDSFYSSKKNQPNTYTSQKFLAPPVSKKGSSFFRQKTGFAAEQQESISLRNGFQINLKVSKLEPIQEERKQISGIMSFSEQQDEHKNESSVSQDSFELQAPPQTLQTSGKTPGRMSG